MAKQLTSILNRDCSKVTAADSRKPDIESGFIEVRLRPEREEEDEETPRFEQTSATLGSEKLRSRSEQPAKPEASDKDHRSRHLKVELLTSDLRSDFWSTQRPGLARAEVGLARARLVRQQVPSQFDCSSGYKREWLNI